MTPMLVGRGRRRRSGNLIILRAQTRPIRRQSPVLAILEGLFLVALASASGPDLSRCRVIDAEGAVRLEERALRDRNTAGVVRLVVVRLRSGRYAGIRSSSTSRSSSMSPNAFMVWSGSRSSRARRDSSAVCPAIVAIGAVAFALLSSACVRVCAQEMRQSPTGLTGVRPRTHARRAGHDGKPRARSVPAFGHSWRQGSCAGHGFFGATRSSIAAIVLRVASIFRSISSGAACAGSAGGCCGGLALCRRHTTDGSERIRPRRLRGDGRRLRGRRGVDRRRGVPGAGLAEDGAAAARAQRRRPVCVCASIGSSFPAGVMLTVRSAAGRLVRWPWQHRAFFCHPH